METVYVVFGGSREHYKDAWSELEKTPYHHEINGKSAVLLRPRDVSFVLFDEDDSARWDADFQEVVNRLKRIGLRGAFRMFVFRQHERPSKFKDALTQTIRVTTPTGQVSLLPAISRLINKLDDPVFVERVIQSFKEAEQGEGKVIDDPLIVILVERESDQWKRCEKISERVERYARAGSDLVKVGPLTGQEAGVRFDLEAYTVVFVSEDLEDLDDVVKQVVKRWKQDKNYVVAHNLDAFIKDRSGLARLVDVLASFRNTEDYADFTNALNNFMEGVEGGDSDIGTRCENLEKAIISLENRRVSGSFSMLKHRIARLLLPIDIDLQGWTESAFNPEYGGEILEAYKDKKAWKSLAEVRKLLYDASDGSDANSLSAILRRAGLSPLHASETVDDIEKAKSSPVHLTLRKLRGLLPPDDVNEQFRPAWEILFSLNVGDLQSLQTKLTGDNPFHKWLADLDDLLDNLRDQLNNAKGE